MNTTITPRTAVADLVGVWLEQLRAEQRLDRTTIDEYERVLNKFVIPSLGTTIISDSRQDWSTNCSSNWANRA
jgi:hypothetical protein